MSEFSRLSAVIVGVGSIGRRHIRNLKTLGIGKIVAVDPNDQNLQSAIQESAVDHAADLSQALAGNPDLVLVCSPPIMHVEHAVCALRAGSHVFIEKPLAHRLEDVDRLVDEAAKAKRVVQVGYNLRFIPALIALKVLVDSGEFGRPLWARFEFGQYLPDWRPAQDYRQGYTARKSMGGGIILDGSHEIDLAMWLLGKPTSLACMAGKVSDLEMDVEDSATLLLRFESGVHADIHLDCVQREYSRALKIAFERGTVTWSWPDNILRIFEAGKDERYVAAPDGYVANQMYLDEIRAFLCAVGHGSVSPESLSEGREVVRVALSALEASDAQVFVNL